MQPRILKTDGGPHSGETWAILSADVIFPIDDPIAPMAPERRLAAMQLQTAIAVALAPHHGRVQEDERGKLLVQAHARFTEPCDGEAHLDEAVAAIQSVATGTPWQTHFQDPSVIAAVRGELGRHFGSAQDIERQWHAHRNPDNAAGQAYLARIHGTGA